MRELLTSVAAGLIAGAFGFVAVSIPMPGLSRVHIVGDTDTLSLSVRTPSVSEAG